MTDILIIGGGAAGLSAAVYAKRAGLNIILAEKVYSGAGQIAESNKVDNYLGYAGISGYELGEKFREHAASLGVEIKNGEAVKFIRSDNLWKAEFKDGDIIETKTIIYAAGAIHRHLNIPGEREFAGKGVSYCATCDGAFFKEKTTAVIGGGNTALDDALYLSDISRKVYIIHRRDKFRGSYDTVKKLQEKENVEMILGTTPVEITGEKAVKGVKLENGTKLCVDGVFIAVGMTPVTEPVKEIVKLDESGYIIAGEDGKTSAEGFFAAGDVRTKNLRQIITAASDGANAAMQAEQYVRRYF